MDRFLESEMQGAIFCDPNFVRNFLTVDSTRLQAVLENCQSQLDAVYLRKNITQEDQLYEPIRRVLNVIKQAVDGGSDASHSFPFVDVSAEPIACHYDDMAGIRPDLVLFDGPTRHWETVRLPIEVKTQETFLKVGMKQLTRYARAVFAHQLHRRHLYGLVVCKWEATFVRFDRSGILNSKPIDIRRQREEFCEAFAGLMMLDEEAFGYDTAFTTRTRRDGRLQFYVDLPADAFPAEEGTATEPNSASPNATAGPSHLPSPTRKRSTRRLRVMEKLCHRKSIRGRATIVLRVREVIRPGALDEPEEAQGRVKTRSRTKRERQPKEEVEQLGTRDYVLKLMWRDPNKTSEAKVLERLVGIYGVAQYLWHSDAFKACDAQSCERPSKGHCDVCLDRTPDRDQVLVTENLTDLNIDVPGETEGGGEIQYKAVKTDRYSKAYVGRTSRIYCRLLMSSVGSPLCTAESPRQLLQAVLDAILGYWRLVNKGLLHRDVSDGNVLMLQDPNGYTRREWKDQRVTPHGQDPTLAKSEALLQKLLDDLDRDPSGILNDFDLFTTHNWMGVSFFDDSSSEEQVPGVDAKPGTSVRSEDADADERGSKRRKLNPTIRASTLLSSSGKGKEREVPGPQESSLACITKADKGACQGIDFRTGTPTFMSLRVLRTPIGQRYEHSFMDDLESFFWLILWCVLERVEPSNTNPGVDTLLNLLDQPSLENITSKKSDFLAQCVRDGGEEMKDVLALCRNSWATDPMVANLILEMGSYFNNITRKKIFDYTPVKVFPKIVKMITDALNRSDSDSTDSDSD
ncbi:hypothetical protein FRC08_018970 [Ceratobasidium sp. 394]|nr:hypothetical protein FRC08_018970 [Ceratobasidium sp. 394]